MTLCVEDARGECRKNEPCFRFCFARLKHVGQKLKEAQRDYHDLTVGQIESMEDQIGVLRAIEDLHLETGMSKYVMAERTGMLNQLALHSSQPGPDRLHT
jgi:hypothetical protein